MANCETHGHVPGTYKCFVCGKPNPTRFDPLEIPLRDQFAIAALMSTPNWIKDWRDGYPEIARRCYVMADDMLEARKSGKENL